MLCLLLNISMDIFLTGAVKYICACFLNPSPRIIQLTGINHSTSAAYKQNLLYVWAVPVHGVAIVPVDLTRVHPREREEEKANSRESHYYIPPLPCTRCLSSPSSTLSPPVPRKTNVFITFLRLGKRAVKRFYLNAVPQCGCLLVRASRFPQYNSKAEKRSSKASWAPLSEFTEQVTNQILLD